MCVLTCAVHICEQGEGEKGNNTGVKMPEAIVGTIFILASLQVYILLHSLGAMQINIGFSACVMACIPNPPLCRGTGLCSQLRNTKAPTLCNLCLHKHALHSDLWDKKCVNCSVYKIKPSIWEQHSSPCRAKTYSWMQQWKWQLASWACTAWELVGFVIWCGRKWLTKVFSCLSYYHF